MARVLSTLRITVGHPIIAIGLAVVCLSVGCTENVGDQSSYSAEKPSHPAMNESPSAQPVAASADPHGGNPHGGSNPHGAGGLPTGSLPAAGGGSLPATSQPPAQGAAPDKDGHLTVAGLHLSVPEGWVSQPPSNRMRKAQFRLPHAEGDAKDGELTVIPSGGALQENVRRWEGQFGGAPSDIETLDVKGMEVVIVTIRGTYQFKERPMAPGPATPLANYTMYAAIVQAPQAQLFFKAVGPSKTIEKWKGSIDTMIQSFHGNH